MIEYHQYQMTILYIELKLNNIKVFGAVFQNCLQRNNKIIPGKCWLNNIEWSEALLLWRQVPRPYKDQTCCWIHIQASTGRSSNAGMSGLFVLSLEKLNPLQGNNFWIPASKFSNEDTRRTFIDVALMSFLMH